MFRPWRSEKHVAKLVDAYLAKVTECLGLLKDVFPQCLDGSLGAQSQLENPVHRFESVADDMRRALEKDLIAGRLLPDSRAEMLSLVEVIDHLPNRAESVVELFAVQNLQVPETLRPDVSELLAKALETFAAMTETVRTLLADVHRVPDLVADVDQLESQCDRIERQLMRRIFQLDMDLARKLHLRDLVRALAGIADKAENVSDMVQWIAARRRP